MSQSRAEIFNATVSQVLESYDWFIRLLRLRLRDDFGLGAVLCSPMSGTRVIGERRAMAHWIELDETHRMVLVAGFSGHGNDESMASKVDRGGYSTRRS